MFEVYVTKTPLMYQIKFRWMYCDILYHTALSDVKTNLSFLWLANGWLKAVRYNFISFHFIFFNYHWLSLYVYMAVCLRFLFLFFLSPFLSNPRLSELVISSCTHFTLISTWLLSTKLKIKIPRTSHFLSF